MSNETPSEATRFPIPDAVCADLEKRFTYHAPNGSQPERYVAIRQKAKEFATLLVQTVHQSRELSSALTKVEEACFHANAGIARNG